MATKICPNCGWRKDIDAQNCHCGYDFTARESASGDGSRFDFTGDEPPGENHKAPNHPFEASERLLNDLKTGDTQQQQVAAYELGKIRDPAVVPALIEAFQDANPSVRYHIEKALRKTGGQEAKEFLKSLQVEEDSEENAKPSYAWIYYSLGFFGCLVLMLFGLQAGPQILNFVLPLMAGMLIGIPMSLAAGRKQAVTVIVVLTTTLLACAGISSMGGFWY